MSPYLSAIISAAIVAQLFKYILYFIKSRRLANVNFLYQSGNMPSAHTAVVTSLLVVIGVIDGVNSNTFAITLVVGIIVAYDAMQVRRAAGEQGLAIRELLTKAKVLQMPYNALGHRPIEVLGGAAVGTVVGIAVVFFATK